MRRAHLLKRNHANELPWEAIWVDTETAEETIRPGERKHVLRFGWACYRRRWERKGWTRPDWHRFETPAQFWDWVFSRLHGRSRVYVFAHNGAFDYPVLDAFNILPREGWKLTKAVIESPPIILNWRKGPHSILMLDTLNIWRVKLAEIGKTHGLPKLRMPPLSASPTRWDAYCRRDVKVIMRACLGWWDFLARNDLGGFAPTLASQALRTYRHRFMSHPILIDDHPKALALARESYLGGRTECFRLGRIEGPLYLVDVNGMYPYVMHRDSYPTRLIGYTERATPQDLAEWFVDRTAVADVTIHTSEPCYPCLVDKRLCFPVGYFRTCLAGRELERAVIRGEVLTVHRVALYERAHIFRDFVEYFHQRRLAMRAVGNKVEDHNTKILGNSLYGKFGQRGRVYDVVGEDESPNPRAWIEYDADTGQVRKFRSLAGVVQEYRDESEARDSHPAIASHVTAGARLHLWDLIVEAGRPHCYYTDTDSLRVDQVGYDRLTHWLDDKRLGYLKLERVTPWVEQYGLKDYDDGAYRKTKGVSKEPYWNESGEVVQDQWSSLVGLVRVGDLTGPRTTMVAKHLTREYTKGRVQPDGVVLPLVLP